MRRKTYLATSFLILTWSVMPILALQSSSQKISSQGMVKYPAHELGVWYVLDQATILPTGATWVVPESPNYVAPAGVSAILNWVSLHRAYYPTWNPFRTETDIKTVEQGLKTIPVENFWGIIFICEEHYRTHVQFDDDVDTTWFGERLLGYPLYLAENPGVTKDQWQDEMFLRMIRGFHSYFHPYTKVGITVEGGSIIEGWRNEIWAEGIGKFFGQPAFSFIKANYDFVILYAYTEDLEFFLSWTSQYYSVIDEQFTHQKKFWILTKPFLSWTPERKENWEREAIALEMKNCLDRNLTIVTYQQDQAAVGYYLRNHWADMLKAIELRNSEAPYFEKYVHGQNLLTGYAGNTYGWVEV